MSDCEMFVIGIVNGNTGGSFDGIDPANGDTRMSGISEKTLRKSPQQEKPP